MLVSLGSITALVSWLVRQDLQIAAEENNFEINRRSAAETESTLANVRSNSRMLIQAITAVGTESAIAQDSVDFFFQENVQIAAIFFSSGGQADTVLVNSRFFNSREIDAGLADSYLNDHRMALRRASAGETIVLNATPHFSFSSMAFFFQWRNGGAGVLFSPAALNDSFGSGINQSYLLNDSGDILIHADFEQVRDGVNVADRNYTRYIGDNSARNAQTLFTDEDGIQYFRAFTKLNIGGCTVVTSIEYDKVFEGIAATTRRNIYLTAAVLLISIMLIWFFAKSISVPLKALAKAAQVIEGGSFEVNLRPKGKDEVGVLTSSFQRMCSALGIFGRFTNRDIAIRAMRGEIRPGGLPKHATIFFSDIRGFTEKSESFTKTFGEEASDRIVYWLNKYLTRMVECVEKTNGAVDKFIGDAVMAHWGTAYTSGSPQQDAYNCVVAALMMRKALHYANKERQQNDPGNPPIQIGCGINTGIVTAGQIGSDLRMEYTVIGDPVNLASRIEALNKPFGTDILISENTWNLVKEKFITEEMPSVTVKGKKKPLRIFAVVNTAGRANRPQSLADVRKLLGINAPDISRVDVNAHEEKYQIGGTE
ncbi:MAG: HAMP domain-containing protein [Treponema sp.]|nr:HAMP domain-containing protein [Treponema sp.]